MCFTTSQKEKTSFYAIKTRSSESRKIRIFPNRLVNGFGQKFSSFFILLFKAKQARKMCFTIFQKGKTPFLQTIKTRSLKSRKFVFFAKGLVHDFWSKIGNFSIFLFQAKQARKMCFTIFQNEKTFFQTIKTTS